MNLENEIIEMCEKINIIELLKILNNLEQLKEQLVD